MIDGDTKGFLVHRPEPGRGLGQRRAPAPGAGQPRVAGRARHERDRDGGVVVRLARRSSPASIAAGGHRHRGLLPARRRARGEGRARSPTPSGCSSGTRRRSSRPATARSELWFAYHLFRAHPRAARRLDRPEGPADPRPDVGLPDCRAPTASPTPPAVLQEINGRHGRRLVRRRSTRSSPTTARRRAGRGSTRASTPTASTRPPGASPGAEQNWIAPRVGLGVAGRPPDPLQPRLGRPGRQARGRSARGTSGGTPRQGRWTGWATPPTSSPTSRRTTARRAGATGMAAIAGDNPFILHPDGLGWIYAQSGLVDGPAADPLRAARVAVPPTRSTAGRPTRRARSSTGPTTRTTPAGGEPGSEVFPFVLTTYRLTEHHTAGGMSRTVPYLSELQPEMFCEVSPELAAERGLEHGGWATIVTRAHGDRGARPRHASASQPLEVQGQRRSTRSACPTTGAPRPGHRRRGQRAAAARRWTRTCTSASTRPRRATSGRAGARAAPALRRAASTEYRRDGRGRDMTPRWGSSPTRRCASAARRARWPARSGTRSPSRLQRLHRDVLRQHDRPGRRHVAPRRVHRAGQAAGVRPRAPIARRATRRGRDTCRRATACAG